MSSPVRVVLAGCGGICRAWLNAVKDSPEVEIVGLDDINEENMAKVAGEFGFEKLPRSTELAPLLAELKPDAVFDCTVPEAHVQITITALEHGCHVLGEKPLADSMANARKMVEAARAAGKIYSVIQNRRYQPAIRSFRKFIDSGKLGRVSTVNADFYIGAHFGGFRDHMQHVLLLDMAIHSFDQARLITGADPVSVYCHEWNPHGSWYDHDASAQCIFEMSGGLVLNYRGSWCSEGLNTSWECQWRAVGEKGTVEWNGGDKFEVELVKASAGFSSELAREELPIETPPGMELGHEGVITEFIRCVQHGGTPETVCTDNIKSLAMVFGAIESAEKAQKINIQV